MHIKFFQCKSLLQNFMITLKYKIHSRNVGSYFSNSKTFFNIKKYGKECVERGVQKGASSWWVQHAWKYFSNVVERLQEQEYITNKSLSTR